VLGPLETRNDDADYRDAELWLGQIHGDNLLDPSCSQPLEKPDDVVSETL
jgi:hypothetical protein